MTIEQKLRKLAQALKSCDGTEGRAIARRNARARVLLALRAVRAHVDNTYPSIVDRTGAKRLTLEGRVARLKRQGWVEIDSGVPSREAGDYALHGVPVKTIRVSNPQQGAQPIRWTRYFIPSWADDIGLGDTAKLRAAVKNRTYRKALQVEAAILQNAN